MIPFSLRAFVCGTLLISLTACSGSEPPPPPDDPVARREVEDFFLRFRERIQAGETDSLPKFLSKESLNWLDDVRRASRSEPKNYLEERPFFEILCILTLRIERRIHPTFDERPTSLLQKLVVEANPVRKSLLKTDLGPAHIQGEVAYMGLREAPNVPVFHFLRENHVWKFHLFKSFPLILQGAESIGRQRKPTHLLQAIFILEQFGHQPVFPEDLNR